MQVDAHTRIAALLKHHPQALEAIVSLNPRFEKLRNPLLRKLMAGRTSIGMAAKIAGCTEGDFYRVLQPLGFAIPVSAAPKSAEAPAKPAYLHGLAEARVRNLDVRPLLEGGTDPLKEILAATNALQPGEVLKLINTFEPTPLFSVLRKKGFSHWVNSPAPGYVETYFFREAAPEPAALAPEPAAPKGVASENWEEMTVHYAGRLQRLDVRTLEMPQPMIRILEALEQLPEAQALYVLHKRLPLYLLPELEERGFTYCSKALSEHELHLLIFRS